MLRVVTNNVPREVIDDGSDEAHFIYRGEKHYLNDFMLTTDPELQKQGWDGIHTDTFFSATVIKPVDGDWEAVIVGRVYS